MKRIEQHPIIENFNKVEKVQFSYQGKPLEGFLGEPIAMALKAHGIMVHRYTEKRQEPRGVFCAIGRCTDCVMVVNGQPNVRTCVTPLEPGMIVSTQYGLSKEKWAEKNAPAL